MEAFACHPRIGERKAGTRHGASLPRGREQSNRGLARRAMTCWPRSPRATKYEERFGFTYIVCATGKSAEEMLAILKRRLASDARAELREAAEQQTQITQIRLGKWLDRMSAITTHVLDAVLGKPAAGVAVRLEQLEGGGWIRALRASATDADGRCRDLAQDAPAGDYRLTFDRQLSGSARAARVSIRRYRLPSRATVRRIIICRSC
jgi:hypothetical protein